ncbi:carbon catabolite repression protein cred [Dendryphion nanum]|uniref:Carbon catabolite repression protein cred n=1 Tax=Dendryphion nanum TaxID=256645 RepID=A0A9P9IHE4_9PLEO|nr:carbon catabolite repression protein cred [Dendryphion nanum]
MPHARVPVFGGSKPVLEIKPQSSFVVLYGEPSESQPVDLVGKLVLTNPESMSVKGIKMTLLGMRRIQWHSTYTTASPQPIMNKCEFMRETLNLFPADGNKNKAHKINAGSHEWDFKFPIPGNADESVEGIATNWIVYTLSATVDRGYMSKALTTTHHIRIIRTLGRDLLETMPMEQINEDIWASKLAYKITVPQKNYIVGTTVRADFVLVPLRKGVDITTIKMELVESRQMFVNYAGRRVSHTSELVVAHKEGEMPENSTHLVPDGVDNVEEIFDESHRFSMALELPKSLKNCRQSVDTDWLRISHKLRLYVNLHNPEGHTSQLLVKNHVHLFISPNLPPNEDQSVVVDPSVLSSTAMEDEANRNAPPTYGLHQLDELYNDIDPSGFMTPGGIRSLGNSGANTPFYGHSRSGSAEDITSLDAITNDDEASSRGVTNGGGASASALQHRLQNLSLTSNNRSTRYVPGRQHSSGGSTPQDYFGSATEYDMAALSRTPSYNTAVRTPGPRTPISYQDLPSYEIATSRPSSPSRTPRSDMSSSSSPARSLDTLREETERNTEMNSRRASPRDSPRTSDDTRR